jgi:hypothetical protein
MHEFYPESEFRLQIQQRDKKKVFCRGSYRRLTSAVVALACLPFPNRVGEELIRMADIESPATNDRMGPIEPLTTTRETK